MDLDKKVALVTGAGRGIGKDIAISLAKEGCSLVLVSRTEKQLSKAKKEIEDSGGRAEYFAADISEKGSIEKIIKSTLDVFSGIDILINNAAILFSSDFLDISEKDWDTTMAINLKASFLLSQAVMKHMKEKKSGYIINVSSTAALEVPPGIAAYGISKLAMVGLSQALYEYGKDFGVKVSTIYPGMTDTEMLRGFGPPVDPKKWMLPEDIAGCILFLLKQSERVVVKDIIPWASKHDKI